MRALTVGSLRIAVAMFAYKAARKLRLKSKSYEKDIEFAYEAWRNKFKISYVKIKVPIFHPKSAVLRGFKNFFYLLKLRFSNHN